MYIFTTFRSGKKAEVRESPSHLSASPTPLMLPTAIPTTLVTNTKHKDTRTKIKGYLVSVGNGLQLGITYYADRWPKICFHSFPDPSLH